jgi:DNA (cytosine-5)-methyltransferase 1
MLKVATVFSGIGAAEFALRRLGIEHQIVFACDNGEREIDYDLEEEMRKVRSLKNAKEKRDYVESLYQSKTRKTNFVKETYLANYPCPETSYFEDVRLLDGRDFADKVDLFIGGSPCQSFSSVGFQGGLEDARGTLFYDFARLIKEIRPKVFIYENVRNLLNHDGGKTWNVIKNIFDSLGYSYSFSILNSSDYGIPQTRRRLFVVGIRNGEAVPMPPATHQLPFKMQDFLLWNCAFGGFEYTRGGAISISKKKGKVDPKYTLTPLLYNYVMKSGTKSFYQKPIINKDIARTLLKTMGNRHRAGIDNYVSKNGSTKLGDVRMLTERECLRLMGFTDDFKVVVSRSQCYKQAGNSIVVDVMMAILQELFEKGALRI